MQPDTNWIYTHIHTQSEWERVKGGREREPSDRQRSLLICLRWQLEMPPNNYKVAYRERERGRENG